MKLKLVSNQTKHADACQVFSVNPPPPITLSNSFQHATSPPPLLLVAVQRLVKVQPSERAITQIKDLQTHDIEA